jgi:hypothetical protein
MEEAMTDKKGSIEKVQATYEKYNITVSLDPQRDHAEQLKEFLIQNGHVVNDVKIQGPVSGPLTCYHVIGPPESVSSWFCY